MGRPSEFNQDVADAICAELAAGRSLREICADADMPSRQTVYNWLAAEHLKAFVDQYARAREIQADTYAEMMHEVVAENPQVEIPTKFGSYTATDSAGIARNRLRWDNLKWHSSKLAPKKYGDKMEHTGANGGPLIFKVETL